MKNFFFLAILFISINGHSQTSGEITYEEKVNLHMRFTGDREHLKEFVPEYRSEIMVLLFNENESMYMPSENQPEPEMDFTAGGEGGRFMRFRSMRENNKLYQNLAEDRRVEERMFFDKTFLIKGTPITYTWKLTGENMQVGSYVCYKATFEDSTRTIEAWFTPQIPVPVGPAQYGQLPGLILHVDINKGERTLTAVNIELKEIEKGVMKEPTKGKEVTQEEFDEIVRERTKEMDEMVGGHGGHQIRIIRQD
jgi:GLPGLI family protein